MRELSMSGGSKVEEREEPLETTRSIGVVSNVDWLDHPQGLHQAKVTLGSPQIGHDPRSSCYLVRGDGGGGETGEGTDDERVVFFDLDNTLYSKRLGIAEEMGHRIQLFFQTFLQLPAEESARLGRLYYLDYGLAIKGLLENFQIDADAYDSFVDGGLQLDSKLSPDPSLTDMLLAIKARRWIFTNAGLRHARRVLQLLGVEGLFEGIVYCDYREPNFPAKPDRLAFERAMRCARVERPDRCWFVDDSKTNVRTALELGWHAVHLEELPEEGHYAVFPQSEHLSIREIGNLQEIIKVFPDIFHLNNHDVMARMGGGEGDGPASPTAAESGRKITSL